ncbi:hypothetical protein AVEN_235473-1 [Araneus ventricosus]|uniref:Uncharacterized protein n=1 Tax=Araneus ventricosus TaxID=182803 RepID=A0A4Y2A3X5_ARAVE|nr:hypothetical protein AVEN_235473-1 [Araneus ventricosus]
MAAAELGKKLSLANDHLHVRSRFQLCNTGRKIEEEANLLRLPWPITINMTFEPASVTKERKMLFTSSSRDARCISCGSPRSPSTLFLFSATRREALDEGNSTCFF